MIGRIIGFVIGLAIAVTGYGMLKPAMFAKYFNFSKLSVGPFGEYKTLVCWMIVALGAAVAVAALQRPSGGTSSRKKAAPAMFDPVESGPAHGPLMMDPEPAHAETHSDHHDHDDHHGHQVDHHEIHTPEPAH